MLKVSQVEVTAKGVTLRLEGRVVGAWIAVLETSCEQVLSEGKPLQLRLAEVEFMDGPGVALLTSLLSRGVVFLECPAFAAAQLRMAGAPISPPEAS